MLITITRNIRTGRFHPFIWNESPLPSSDVTDHIVRFRSKMHHTSGFESLEDARTSAREELSGKIRDVFGIEAVLRLDAVDEDLWEEGEVPARVIFSPRLSV